MAVIDERFEHVFEEMRALRIEMRDEMRALRAEMHAGFAQVHTEFAQMRSDMSAHQRQMTHIFAGFAIALLGAVVAQMVATL